MLIEEQINDCRLNKSMSAQVRKALCDMALAHLKASKQEQYTGFDRTASHNAGEYREFQRESLSNPSPVHGQSKQGLTESHSGAPTTIKGWVISEAEQKLLDEYGACFAEPTDAQMLSKDLYNRLCSLGKDRYLLISQDEAEKCIAALRAKDKP